VNDDGDSWYSYDLGTWHVIVLDANCANVGGCTADSKQGQWLAGDLAAHSAFCTIAIWHQPRFSSGDEHGNDPSVAPFWDALHAAGADVVVNGHDHDYERFAPQDPKGRIEPPERHPRVRRRDRRRRAPWLRQAEGEQRAPPLARARRHQVHPPPPIVRLAVDPGRQPGHRFRQRAVPLRRTPGD
jgi:hypothetical protein